MSRPTAKDDRLIGSTIAGNYQVLRRIGRGGMGAVYEARHIRMGRVFALKTLSTELDDNSEALRRFRREADIIARLDHPNIVNIIDWDVLDDGAPFMVMELLRGESLSHRIKREGKLSWATIGLVGDQIASALTVAHNAGVVHRDLKPDNIFLAVDDAGEARAKLLDFGVSKVHDSRTIATADERLLGTPAYMAPEQADGRPDEIGPATDIWALGAILFEMASGQAAFEGPSVPALLYQICHGKPRSLVPLRADAPAEFGRLVAACMSHEAHRIARADLLRVHLRRALGRIDEVVFTDSLDADINAMEHVGALPTTLSSTAGESLGPLEPRSRKRGAILAAFAAVALLAGGGAVLYTTSSGSKPPTTNAAPTPVPAAAPSPPATEAPAEPAQPKSVTIEILSSPTGAAVYRAIDGVRIGETPYRGAYPEGEGALELSLRLDGYRTETIEVETTSDTSKTLELVQKQKVATKKRRRTRKKTKKRGEKSSSSNSKLGNKTVNPFGQ